MKKILVTLSLRFQRFFPYWCNFCLRRYRKEQKFHEHYLSCPVREKAIMDAREARERAIARIAPVNRAQRRKMAKKAGQIKHWGELNRD